MADESKSNKVLNCVTGSVFLHASLAVGLALVAPHIEAIPEALSGEFIEFESPGGGPQIVEVAIAEAAPAPAPPKPKPTKAAEAEAPVVKKEVQAPSKEPVVEAKKIEPTPVVKVKKETAPPPAAKAPAKEAEDAAPDTIDDGELAAQLEREKELEKAEKEREEMKAQIENLKAEAEKMKAQAEAEKAAAAAQLAQEQAQAEEREKARAEEERLAEEQRLAAVAAAKKEAERAKAEAVALQEKLAREKELARAQAEEARRQAELARQQAEADKAAQIAAAKREAQARARRDAIKSGAAPQSFYSLQQRPGNMPPQYSSQARLNKQSGQGQLYYYVTKDGRVTQLRLTKSTGHVNLDSAAAQAFSRYKFVPGQEGWTVHNFEFNLKGEAEAQGGRLRTGR